MLPYNMLQRVIKCHKYITNSMSQATCYTF